MRAPWLALIIIIVLPLAGCGDSVTETPVDDMPRVAYNNGWTWALWISPDWQHVAVAHSQSATSECIAIDGVPGPSYHGLNYESVTWLPDGNRCIYIARHPTKGEIVVVGTQELEGLGGFSFATTQDGKRWALCGWGTTASGPGLSARLFLDGNERKVDGLSAVRFARASNMAYFKVNQQWQDEQGKPAPTALLAELETKPTSQYASTPRYARLHELQVPAPATAPGVMPQIAGAAATSAKAASLPVELKVKRFLNNQTHQLYVKGQLAGEYDQVFVRSPTKQPREWHHVATDGTVTLYATRNGRIYRITIRP